MALTTEQKQTLKTAINAETNVAFVALRQTNDEQGMADFYNVLTSPAWYAWRPVSSVPDVLNSISWASLTPADAADGTSLFTNRALVCQAKQLNLQIILQGQQQVATGKLNIRQGLSDALQNVPAGVGGALVDAGWAGANKVKAVINRVVRRGERIFASGTGTTAVPGELTFEGTFSAQDISDALRA